LLPVPSSTSRVAPGIDVKGEGGYVVAPPSVHPDGPQYRWLNDEPVAEAPSWLLVLARKPSPPLPSPPTNNSPRKSFGSPGGYGAAALRSEIDTLANTCNGNRNNQLFKSSASLHELVAGQELKDNDVTEALIKACEANGLLAEDGLRSVLATIHSGAKAGRTKPRKRPEVRP
jgi:Bifunctional DNA primase/polymerase, N-terminal